MEETYRSGLVQLAGRVKDERTLRRAWMVLNRRADAEEHPRRRNNPEALDYHGMVIDLIYKIDDPYKLRTLYEVTHTIFLRDDRPQEKQRQTARKETNCYDKH